MEAEARAALIDYVALEEPPIEYRLATRIRERLAELDAFVEIRAARSQYRHATLPDLRRMIILETNVVSEIYKPRPEA